MIKGFAHVALYTEKYDETIAFYTKAFGAESLGEFMTAHKGNWLKIGDSILEVFEEVKLPTGLFKHIALEVDSVDKTIASALAAGGTLLSQPKNVCLKLNEPQNLRIAFVAGPSGEEIELCEKI